MVDEFAALVQEIPEFVDGVVDVAQRGRSLGLHLILATQRPAGVIKDNLRANTNLRIALRMADEHDSSDVLGSPMAAHFDPRVPGRGAVRTGPGRLEMFQSGYVGGRSDDAPPPAQIGIETLTFGPGEPWLIPPAPDTTPTTPTDGPTDAARIVTTLRTAAERAAIPAPRRPWLDEIPTVIALDTHTPHTDGDLPLGMVDVPADQAQVPFRYRPDDDGSLVVYGTSGSGKSTALRTIAVSAATATGHVRIYALDFAGGALSMLEALPQVGAVIPGNDSERLSRLVTELIACLDARAVAYSEAHADNHREYRDASGEDLPRIFVLIDGLSAFRENYENETGGARVYADVMRLISEGRAVGIHVILAAERPNAVSTALAAILNLRLILRQADENAYLQLGAPKDILARDAAPGRGVLAGSSDEVQLSVVAGSPTPALQAEQIATIAAGLRAKGAPCAPPIRSLSSLITQETMPDRVGKQPALGVANDTLEPMGFSRSGAFMVAGMAGSGRSTALLALGAALRRHRPDLPVYFVGPRRSPAAASTAWERKAHRLSEIKELLADITPTFEEQAEDDLGATLVVEGLADYINSEVDSALTALFKAARRNGHLVIAETETPGWTSAWPLVTELRNERRGLVLQPDQPDGDTLFRTSFPRMKRSDYPLGRGIYVTAGKARVVQLPVPTPGDTTTTPTRVPTSEESEAAS